MKKNKIDDVGRYQIGFVALAMLIWVFTIGAFTYTAGKALAFDATSSLFSALAFAGVMIAVYLQRKDLLAQKEELALTRKEFAQQNETLSKQRFENTFFQLLGIFNGITSREHFLAFVQRFDQDLNTRGRTDSYDENKQRFKDVDTTLKHPFVSYWQYIKTILDYIYASKLIEETEKKFYVSILFSQLSPAEKKIMYYFAVFGLADKRFIALTRHYQLFSPISELNLKDKQHDQYIAYTMPGG